MYIPSIFFLQELVSALDCYHKLAVMKNNKDVIDISTKLLKFANTNKDEHPYVLRRLILGMKAVSQVSQQNHFLCLVEFLRQNTITFQEVEDSLQKHLRTLRVQDKTKNEEAMCSMARILTYLAVFRSGMPMSHKDKKSAVDNILSDGVKKNYLCVLALKGIVDNLVGYEQILSLEAMVCYIVGSQDFKIKNANLSSLHFICYVLNNSELDPKIKNECFGFEDASDSFFVDGAVNAFMGVTESIEYVRSHPLINEIINLITKQSIVTEFVAKMAAKATTSTHKTLICLEIVTILLKKSPEAHQDILSSEVLSLICRNGESRDLDAESPLIIQLNTMVKNNQITPQSMLLKFIKCSVLWDKYIPGKLALTLFNKADKELLDQVESVLCTIFKGDETTTKRLYAAGLLSKIVGHSAVVEDVPKRVAILELLFQHTVVNVEDPSFHPLPKKSRTLQDINNVFFGALDNSCKTFADQIKIVGGCMAIATKLQSQCKFTEEAQESWTKVTKLISTLTKKWKKDEHKETGMFLFLFCNVGLQLFSQPEMAVDILSELFPLYSEWNKSRKSQGDDPSGYELVTDIMLSLLAQSKHWLRSLVKTVFRLLSSQMTQPAIQILVDAIGDESVADKENEEEDMGDEQDSEGLYI